MNDNSQRLTSAVSIFLILASVLWGVLNFSGGLGSARPPDSATIPYLPEGSQAVLARLWQDPFEVFRTNTPPASAGAAPLLKPGLASQIAAHTHGLVLLGVLLEGTPYEADAEMRRRLRYAVEEALLTSDLAPENRDLLGVQGLNLFADGTRRLLTVPFEWFNRAPQSADTNLQNVLLLWLREDDFADQPFLWLGALLTNLLASAGTDGPPPFHLVGPRSSDTLRSLAADTNAGFCGQLARAGRFHILSAEATAPDRFLLSDANAATDPARGQIRRQIAAHLLGDSLKTDAPVIFENWIATDFQLAEALVTELDNRVPAGRLGASDVIAIVSEADTFYGRSLPAALKLALHQGDRDWPATNLWRFDYLRGLEGQKPPGAAPEPRAPAPNATPEATLAAGLRQTGERAEGEAQLDYAARLGAFLGVEDRKLRRDGSRIVAVGLTGNDVYDKLVLLKALRPALPEAVFFTTDLDARLWGPDALPYTRNLLVGSAYSLNPAPGRDRFPPFRDVYQAAVFFATCGAVAQARGETAAPRAANLAGDIYEIGRHGPVRLAPSGAQRFVSVFNQTPPLKRFGGQLVRHGWVAVALATMTLGPLWLVALLQGGFRPARSAVRRWGRERDRRPTAKILLWDVLAVGLLYCGAVAAHSIAHLPGEEPWTPNAGITIWPTEGIRGLAIILSVSFLLLSYRLYQRHREDLWQDYFSDESYERLRKMAAARSDDIRHAASRRGRMWKWIRHRQINSWRTPLAGEKVDARRLFADYLFLASAGRRYLRIVPQVLVYFAAAAALVLFTHSVPDRLCVRGMVSRQFDNVTLGLCVLLFLLVLFYVLDAARLTGKLLQCLTQGRTAWPEALVNQSAAQNCIRPADADGWLDVQFAADKTQETGRLMFYPFILYLLLLLSRHSFFDAWTWPLGIVVIFAANFVLAAACWAMVRRAARKVREAALDRLDAIAARTAAGAETSITVRVAESAKTGRESHSEVCVYSRENYVKRLGEIRTRIDKINRGAFARLIQDPTLLALFIPTGITGILTVLLHYWLNRP